jgi:hypothetical protein
MALTQSWLERWGWVVSITPWLHFTPWKWSPIIHWIGVWVCPRASLEAEARWKILCPWWRLNPGHPVCSQILYWLICNSSLLALNRFEFVRTVMSYSIWSEIQGCNDCDGPPGWGLGTGLTVQPCKKVIVTKPQKGRSGPVLGCRAIWWW